MIFGTELDEEFVALKATPDEQSKPTRSEQKDKATVGDEPT
jgi:hypothetical protein